MEGLGGCRGGKERIGAHLQPRGYNKTAENLIFNFLTTLHTLFNTVITTIFTINHSFCFSTHLFLKPLLP